MDTYDLGISDIVNKDMDIGAGDTKTMSGRNIPHVVRNEGNDDSEGIADMKFAFEDSVLSNNGLEGTIIVGDSDSGIEKADAEKILPVAENLNAKIEIGVINSTKTASPKNKNISTGTDTGSAALRQCEDEKEDISESLEIIREISQILNTKLSFKSLKICTELIEAGADHSVLADLLKNLRLKKAPKPQRVLGHFFDPVAKKEKKEWVW